MYLIDCISRLLLNVAFFENPIDVLIFIIKSALAKWEKVCSSDTNKPVAKNKCPDSILLIHWKVRNTAGFVRIKWYVSIVQVGIFVISTLRLR